MSEGVLFERRELYARFASEDAHEGMQAFLERETQFKHWDSLPYKSKTMALDPES